VQRSPVGLEAVADWHNLAAALHRAGLGKGHREEVRRFRGDFEAQLGRLRQEILAGTVELGRMRSFRISDPKPRLIHAPCFRERILHHALMAQAGPVLDRALVADTYACRVGKGALAAVQRAQHHARRWPWYAQIDIRAYFANIDHATLRDLLARRFKDAGLLGLMGRIVAAHHATPGKGLPIGALTSQQFANYYLSGLDRLLLEGCRVRGLVRYMDDLIWWGDSRESVRESLAAAGAYARERLGLEIKLPVRVGQSRYGASFCGYRILPGQLLLSRRRKRRYGECRRAWEEAYAHGLIDARTLQAGYASALGIAAHTDSAVWRREQLRRHPLAEPLAEL
jgi:RNA-directed DNA polymerase